MSPSEVGLNVGESMAGGGGQAVNVERPEDEVAASVV